MKYVNNSIFRKRKKFKTNRGLTMSKSVSTGTNTRVSRLLNKKAKSKDVNYLNAQETFGFPSTTFKSESILTKKECAHI